MLHSLADNIPDLYGRQLGSFVQMLRDAVAAQQEFLMREKLQLSDHQWCRLLAVSVDALNTTLDRGVVDLQICEPFNPLAEKVYVVHIPHQERNDPFMCSQTKGGSLCKCIRYR